MSALYFSEICRLCLVKNGHLIPIFDGEGHVRRIFLQISTCLPLKMSRDDQLPKSICSECIWRVENQHQFWNTVLNAEKQLLDWLRCPPPQVQSGILQLPSIDIKPIQIPVEERDLMNPDPAISQSLSCVETALEDEDEEVDADFEERELKPTTFVNVSLACDDTASLDIPSISASETVDPVATSSDLQMAGSLETSTKWNCSFCDEFFSNVRLLQMHISTHNNDVYCCSKCKAVFSSHPSAGKHTDACLAQDPLGSISLPSIVIAYSVARLQENEYFVCPIDWCRQIYKGKTHFNMHTMSHQAFPPLKCLLCGQEFHLDDDYLHHKKTCVPAEKRVKQEKNVAVCLQTESPILRKYIESPCDGATVSSIKHDEPCVCHVCGKQCKTKKSRRLHMEAHVLVKKIVCDKCDYRCTRSGQLRCHILNKHSSRRDYVCNTCGKAMSSGKALKKHKVTHGERKYKCRDCEKQFYFTADLKSHSISHDPDKSRPHLCEMCGKNFRHKHNLNSHLQQHINKEKYKCDVCQKVVTTNSALIIHQRRHTGEKPFSCEVCKKTFAANFLLKLHSIVHTGERPFKCKDCDKCYRQRSTLTIHMRTHSGVKPYACEVCSKGFVSKTLMKVHCKKYLH